MDWKKENPKKRYIDDITWNEAEKIAWLAAGSPDEFELLSLDAKCNGNNIPHVELHYRYFEPLAGNGEENYVGIFNNLNTYLGRRFGSAYHQRQIFEAYSEMGFD